MTRTQGPPYGHRDRGIEPSRGRRTLARMHLKPMKSDRDAAHADPLIAIAGGGGVSLFNSMGDAWTADYLKITGELDVDLRSNIAAEARAKIVYERLIDFCEDPGTIDALQFLMTREITHMKAFTAALESWEPAFSIGRIPPTTELVNQYFNDQPGSAIVVNGRTRTVEPGWGMADSRCPRIQGIRLREGRTRASNGHSSRQSKKQSRRELRRPKSNKKGKYHVPYKRTAHRGTTRSSSRRGAINEGAAGMAGARTTPN